VFTIKGSFADCSTCPLVGSGSVIADTNSADDLSKVDVVIVAENPGKEELKAETPLVGKAGKIFREPFDKYIKSIDGIKYFITNTVLCATIENGKTVNPTKEVADRCEVNYLNFIKICKPKLIISLGTTPMRSLIGKDSGITKIQGQFFSYQDKLSEDLFADFSSKVLVVAHPSYVARNGGLSSEAGKKFVDCFKQAAEFLNPEEEDEVVTVSKTTNSGEIKTEKVDEPYTYRIPTKYYEDDYRLVDVQYISKSGQLIFIFRDKDNNREEYTPPPKDVEYYWYEGTTQSLIEDVKNTELKIGKYFGRNQEGHCYESDIKIANKQATDYYMRNKGEAPILHRNILFYDIEVYTGSYRGFPDPVEAKFPINAISFKLDEGEVEMYLLVTKGIDSRWEQLNEHKKFKHVKIFKSEQKMVQAFVDRTKQLNPDYLCGWNSAGFDNPYIINRMDNIGLNSNDLSPFGVTFADPNMSTCLIYGRIPLDQMWLYKNLTYTNEPSYSLENISQKVLNRGKKNYDGDLMNLYRTDIFTFCEYSITDTDLLYGLESELGHLSLQDELRAAATTSHNGASSTIGLADGLFNFELKSHNTVMRNTVHGRTKQGIVGAYVREPVGGIYDWVIDFDYTSLYPSIICSYNIGPNTFVARITPEDAHEYTYHRKKFLERDSVKLIPNPIYNSKVANVPMKKFTEILEKYHAIVSPSGCIYKGHDIEKSIFYNIIKKLFKQRKYYKGLMFKAKEAGNDLERKQYNNKQMAYKILLNSLYGVLAQEHFRFYNLDLASTVTLSGQDLIKFAGEHVDTWMTKMAESRKDMKAVSIDINPNYMTDVEEYKEYLKYCDTDSLFLHMEPYLEKLGIDPNPESIAKETENIHNFLNGMLLTGYAKLHNIAKDESMLDIKSELIARRYYCLNVKKKYALHVVSQEGVATDEVDIKGLEIKRSDFSQLTKDMLEKLIDNILKNDDFTYEGTLDLVNDFKATAIDMVIKGDPSIFKTVAFSKPLNQYKTIPQHLKGMLIWNCLEYDHFRHGNRGILVPIKGIDLDKAPHKVVDNFHKEFLKKWNQKDLNVIVIPETITKIPEYYIVDTQRIIAFAINDRVDILLEPLAKKSNICLF